MDKQFENALAFYQPAPAGWFSGAQRKVEAGGEWLWETLQGDFHEDPSTAQVVTGTVISMIPVVDQLCDLRDFIANCRKIDEDSSNVWNWVALTLTLICAFPIFGSLFKGCFKVSIQSLRRWIQNNSVGRHRNDRRFDPVIIQLKLYLDMPVVRKTLVRMKIHNAFGYLADQISKLSSMLSVEMLMDAFRTLMDATRSLLNTISRWAPYTLTAPVEVLWAMLERVHRQANAGLESALGPTRDYLDALSNRLRVEADGVYRARPGSNVHVLGNRDNAELALITKEKPDWVDMVETVNYPALEVLPSDAVKKINAGWPDISETSKHGGLVNAFRTFDGSLAPSEILPGTRLYRVVDPSSGDNSICWMREAEFQVLKSKSQWRREYAVWKHWNENGEYVLYTVPPGESLKVWEGRAGTQELKADPRYTLEGGRQQIVLNPDELDPKFVSARQKTGWGYDDGTANFDLDPIKPFLGLPDLTHKWRMPEPKKEN